MSSKTVITEENLPRLDVQVRVEGECGKPGFIPCTVGVDLNFSVQALGSYFFSEWEPAVYDAMLVAAAVEFCDRRRPRAALSWGREFNLLVPVHDPAQWQSDRVARPLREALELLTGDRWSIAFSQRNTAESPRRQGTFNLPTGTKAVIPYSDGLDSFVVSSLMSETLGDSLVRVRLGRGTSDTRSLSRKEPFTATPFKVHAPVRGGESSFRSRGFKFLLLGGLAAFLAEAKRVILPESGQGALGPALITSGQAHPDYRNHPRFTRKLEQFINALLETAISYEFPQLWKTKGQGLSEYLQRSEFRSGPWAETKSCWQQSRQVSVGGKHRHCGICAACLLRRLSVHAAGANEAQDHYVWEHLNSPDFETAATKSFDRKKITKSMREYAIAGVLHLDQLASLRHSSLNAADLEFATLELAHACGLPPHTTADQLSGLLIQHEREWLEFMSCLSPNSFLHQWATHANEHSIK